MKKNTDTKYAILGLLTTGCNTGYEIKQLIDRSLNHFWKISYGQLYPILKQLVEEGLATVQETNQEGKPDKKEYYLTDKGKQQLSEWLQSPINIPTEKNEVLLKIFFSRHQPKNTTIFHLETYQEALRQRLDTYKAIEQSLDSSHEDAPYWLYTLDYGKRITFTAIEWCEDTINKIREE